MAEMTDFEAFRFVDTYTEAVLKLRDATHAIRRHGADLKEWEAKGKLVKDKIQKEINVLNEDRALALRKGVIQTDSLIEKGKQAEDSVEPLLQRASTAKAMLEQVSDQLNAAREDKDETIVSAARERDRILQEAYDQAEKIESEADVKVKIAEQRLQDISAKIIQLKREGINSL